MSHLRKGEYADVIIIGKIITMREENDIAEALAIKGDKILSVGSSKHVKDLHENTNTTIVTLGPDQALMPGLIETHSHLLQMMGLKTIYVDINGIDQEGNARTKDDVESIIKNHNQCESNQEGLFIGWDPELVEGLPALSKTKIDELYNPREIPVLIIAESLHIAWPNEAAFKKAIKVST